MTALHNKIVTDYYDSTQQDYELVWHLNSRMAMHYGYWDSKTKSLSEALTRENQILASIAKIKKTDYVLDAGCGVGGSAIYLAKTIGCRVKGITLSKKQVNTAKQFAKREAVSHLVDFAVGDFTKTAFNKNTFDVVWAIESVCHTEDKEKFTNEAYRILKQHGRLVLSDGFSTKQELTPKENQIMKRWLSGWSVDSLDTVVQFKQHLNHSGFIHINTKNITENIMPSARRLYYYSFPAYFVDLLLRTIHKRPSVAKGNVVAAKYQYISLQQKLWEYWIISAEKKF